MEQDFQSKLQVSQQAAMCVGSGQGVGVAGRSKVLLEATAPNLEELNRGWG